jgi:serine-type D-Ala-D-Ala carboxypeptidase/endopeptidase (penicillin-binding protein 4)
MRFTTGRLSRGATSLLLAALIGAAGVISGGVSPSAATPSGGIGSLTQELDALLADARLQGSQADVVVRSATTGETLFDHLGTNRLVPASNDKAYTSLAAMQVLGPNYQFSTTVATSGRDLFLRGTGDPTLQPADYDALAATVAASGIGVVTGHLVADDTFFDHRQYGNNWAWDNNPFSFQPEISGLTVAADSFFRVGSLTVDTSPGATVGRPAVVTTVPATNFVHIVNQATTAAAGSGDNISVERQNGVNDIVVSGTIATDAGVDSTLSTVHDPTGYAASLFRADLERHGVRVLGDTIRAATPAGAHVVTTRQSIPLSQLLTPFLKLSNNAHAEILVKSMGEKAQGAGSWDAGLPSVLSVASQLGVDTSTVQIVDGSGLSNLDFIPALQTTNLLIGAQKEPFFQTWFDALPIACGAGPLVGGTLEFRMCGTPAAGNVHAKTGTLTGASALSGYVTDADGERLVFSVMENNYLSAAPKDLEDAVAIDLAEFSRNGGVPAGHAAVARPATTRPALDPHGHAVECSWTRSGC